MKPIRALLGLSLATASLAIASPTGENNWTSFAPPGAGFRALFPKKPAHLEQKDEYHGKPVKADFYLCNVEAGGLGVVYIQLPMKAPSKAQEKSGLDEVSRKGAESVHGEIVSDQDFDFGGRTAKSVLYKKTDGAYVQAYFIVAGARLYEVIGTGSVESLATPMFKKFFDSFQIVK